MKAVARPAPTLSLLSLALVLWTAVFARPETALGVDFGRAVGPGEFADSVALVRVLDPDQPGQIFCTGVVVHPRIVLTAAHCLQEGAKRPSEEQLKSFIATVRLHLGEGSSGGKIAKDLVPVASAKLHPGYLKGIRGWWDIAILTLANDLPLSPEKIRPIDLDLPAIKNNLLPSKLLTVTGFGHSERPSAASTTDVFGIKHTGEIRIDGKHAGEVQIVGDAKTIQTGQVLQAVTPRQGDSGGPVYRKLPDGSFNLVGLVSRAARLGSGKFGSALTLVRGSMCWIEKETGVRLRRGRNVPDHCGLKGQASELPLPVPTFKEMCETAKSRAPSVQYTIFVLKEILGEAKCERLSAKLESMTNLSLDGTNLTDVTPLATLANLERLSLRDNRIRKAASLSRLKKLHFLDLSYNDVSDLESFAALEKSGMWLVGEERQFSNIRESRFLELCTSLDTSDSQKQTIAGILQALDLPDGYCESASYELARLRDLDLFRSFGLTDMSPLEGLGTIERLSLSGQSVESLEFLANVASLTSLNLEYNPVRDFAPLLKQKNLRELSIENMNLTDDEVAVLAKIPRLRLLKVAGNRLKDFSRLEAKPGLKIEGKDQQNP